MMKNTRVAKGEPNFWIFDALVLMAVIAFFIRFFTGVVDALMGFVALCMVGVWVYLVLYLPRVVGPRQSDPRVDEIFKIWSERPLTSEEMEELHKLLDEEEVAE